MGTDFSRRHFIRLMGTAACTYGAASLLGGCTPSDTAQQDATTTSSEDGAALSEEVVPNYVGTLIPTFTDRTGDPTPSGPICVMARSLQTIPT